MGHKGCSIQLEVFGVNTASLFLLKNRRHSGRRKGEMDVGVFWSTKTYPSPLFEDDTPTAHAPGVPACWPMRGSPPSTSSRTGVVSCSAVITMVFSSTSSQVGLEKADRGRVILCISRSYTRCSCCFFRSWPLL